MCTIFLPLPDSKNQVTVNMLGAGGGGGGGAGGIKKKLLFCTTVGCEN